MTLGKPAAAAAAGLAKALLFDAGCPGRGPKDARNQQKKQTPVRNQPK